MSNLAPREACSILVPSCDAYSDLWRPFIELFWQNWPDCPFDVHLGSNTLSLNDARVRMVHAGHDNNWTNRVKEQVQSLNTPFVLMILEDFFFRRAIDSAEVVACLQALDELRGVMLRLTPRPGPDEPLAGRPRFGKIRPGAPYRVSTQAAIWRRESLLALMRDGESIWEFELKGSVRSRSLPDGFYAVWHPVLTYDHHVVERGKWFRSQARRFGRMGIGCDFTRRPTMALTESFQWNLRKSIAFCLELIPWQTREKLLSPLRRRVRRSARE